MPLSAGSHLWLRKSFVRHSCHFTENFEDRRLDFRGAANSYDLIQICEFKTREDFDAFCVDSYHDFIRKYMANLVEASWKVDYSI